MKNQDIYLDFQTNPSLADALSDVNVGEKVKIELEVMVKSKDEKGISGAIEPNSIVPEGYEAEEPEEGGDGDTTPAPQPPGSLASEPVTQAMTLKKKGK